MGACVDGTMPEPPPGRPRPPPPPSSREEIISADDSSRSEWKSLVGKLSGSARFCNNLPPIPFDPKFLSLPMSSLMKHIKYSSTSLDQNYRIPVLTEPDMGVAANLVDPDAYLVPGPGEEPLLPEEDQELIDLAVARDSGPQTFRAQTNVAWMRKVEYMSNEAFQANPIAQYKSRSETKANYRERAVNQDKIDDAKSEEQKIADIERTFTEPRMEELRHPDPKKQNLRAKRILPILPSNDDLWMNKYFQLMFDENPYAASGRTAEDIPAGLIKGFQKRTRKGMQKLDRFIGYLMPKKDQVAPEASAAEDHEAEEGKPYDWCRNFTFTTEPVEKVFVFTEETDQFLGYNLAEDKQSVHNTQMRDHMKDKVTLKRRAFSEEELQLRAKRQQVAYDE